MQRVSQLCRSAREAYDLLKAIYLERGYRQRDIPELILTKNLYGLDICPRAAQLTAFSLLMKGRQDDRRLLERGIRLNCLALEDTAGLDVERLAAGVDLAAAGFTRDDLARLVDLFEHATTFGSLIQVPPGLQERLPAMESLAATASENLFVAEDLKRLRLLVRQAEILARQYDTVVANPPYMGSKYHTPDLKKFLKDQFPGYEKDVFSAFVDRDFSLSKPNGRLGLMTPFVWMFISSHQDLRKRLIDRETITSLVQLEYSGFEGATVPICTFTLRKVHVPRQKGCFVRLSDFRGASNQPLKTLEAINNRRCGWFFEAAQDDSKKGLLNKGRSVALQWI